MNKKKQLEKNNRYFLNRIISHENKDKLAICDIENEITYRELELQVLETAQKYKKLGVRRNEKIILRANQSIDFVVKYLALHYLGASCLIYPTNLNNFDSDANKVQIHAKYLEDYTLISSADQIYEENAYITDENDIADILFTSGTTGANKGVMHSYSSICQAIDNISSAIQLTADDTTIITLPLYHSNGLGTLRTCLSVGASVILTKGISEIMRLKTLMTKYKCSGLSCSPIIIEWIIKTYKNNCKTIFEKIRYIEIGTAPLSPEKRKCIRGFFGDTAIYINYGSTETPRAVYMDINKTIIDNAIGKVVGDYEFRIFDEKGNTLKAGEIGKLGLKSKAKMIGYLNDLESTEDVFQEGFYLTGDLACVDEDGLIYLKGRINDLIYVSGEKLYPSEIENELNKLDFVADSICVGASLDDNQENQRVVVFILPKDPSYIKEEYEIKGYVSQKLGKIKMPDSIIYLDEIPRTKMGKVDRNQLREKAKEYIKRNRKTHV